MKLSDNFYLKEFVRSHTASRMGLNNSPGSEEIANMKALCVNILQPLRIKYGKEIRIASGYRSATLNSIIGGAQHSQHMKGEAADIDTVKDNKYLFELLFDMEFDQLIWEFGDIEPDWIHVSYVTYRDNRKQILRAYRDQYGTHYSPYIVG